MPRLPLYLNNHDNKLQHDDINKGLHFEKYFNKFNDDWSIKDDAKSEFLQNVSGRCGHTTALENFSLQQYTMTRDLNGEGKVYQLDWHMVIGMGNSHPVENGFLWHSTLGVPYIPGSQVKGIIRSLIEQYFDGDDNEKRSLLREWFGSEEKKLKNQNKENQNNEDQTGRFVFFDAVPLDKPSLVVDIMTPHMGNWYASGDKIINIEDDTDKIPADWHDPTPIPFLAVKDAKFLFTITERGLSSKEHGTIDDVFEMLNKSLEYLGAGAKTQTGYGFMGFDENQSNYLQQEYNDQKQEIENQKTKEQEQIKFQQEISGKSELEKEFLISQEEYKWEKGKGIFVNDKENGADRWLKILTENPQAEVLGLFKNLMENIYKGIYENPDKKSGKKQKPVYRPVPIRITKALRKIIQDIN